MKTRLIKIMILVVLLTNLTSCVNNTKENEIPTCKFSNCENKCIKVAQNSSVYGNYCKDHTCIEDDCTNLKNENENYCSFHQEQKIQLSDSQIEKAREVANEYFEELIKNHSNILNVNIINNNPDTTTKNITFRCNVVREDSDTNLATLYIYITSDGVFKVDKLEYDK